MRRPRLSAQTYRRITLVAAILLGVIIVTGGAVRLSNSGLGCSDWPNCRPGHFTPRSARSRKADPIRTEQRASGPQAGGGQHAVVRGDGANGPWPIPGVSQHGGDRAQMNRGGGG